MDHVRFDYQIYLYAACAGKLTSFSTQTQERRQTFGFKSKNSPPAIAELRKLEESMLKLVSNITLKQRPKGDYFQKQLHRDKNTIKNSSDVLIKADRTNNFHL